MKRITLAFGIAILMARAAYAVPITYTESITATGSLGGTAFTNVPVWMSLNTDTTSPRFGCNAGGCGTTAGGATLSVDGGAPVTFTDPVSVGDNFKYDGVYFGGKTTLCGTSSPRGPAPCLLDIWDTANSAFGSYDLKSTVGPITGGAVANYWPTFDGIFATSGGDFYLSNIAGPTSIFTAATALQQQGGSPAKPVTFASDGLGQISSTIGGIGTSDFYEFSWEGGFFGATASVLGANPDADYQFELLDLSQNIVQDLALNSLNSFSAPISVLSLAAGDYEIGLLADSANDPNFTVTFLTPVNGTAVPEPASLPLFGGAGALLWLLTRRNRRERDPRDSASGEPNARTGHWGDIP